MNANVRNLALQDLHVRLQKIGKEAGVRSFTQLPELDESAACMFQLEAAEQSFAEADMEQTSSSTAWLENLASLLLLAEPSCPHTMLT